ncbi:MAG: hypothetical protein DMG08_00560 [Acidobacteria bacterium]|nr:MAG: hypothetical protein DMG08_00560 [Acidobacteriota bacterium]
MLAFCPSSWSIGRLPIFARPVDKGVELWLQLLDLVMNVVPDPTGTLIRGDTSFNDPDRVGLGDDQARLGLGRDVDTQFAKRLLEKRFGLSHGGSQLAGQTPQCGGVKPRL